MREVVRTPSVDKDRMAVLGNDGAGVLDGLPGELGEGLSKDHITTALKTKSVLLAIGGVPDPVDEEISDVHGRKGVLVPTVGIWVMVCEVNRAMAITEGDSSKIPENQHKAPFLVVDVPVRNPSASHDI